MPITKPNISVTPPIITKPNISVTPPSLNPVTVTRPSVTVTPPTVTKPNIQVTPPTVTPPVIAPPNLPALQKEFINAYNNPDVKIDSRVSNDFISGFNDPNTRIYEYNPPPSPTPPSPQPYLDYAQQQRQYWLGEHERLQNRGRQIAEAAKTLGQGLKPIIRANMKGVPPNVQPPNRPLPPGAKEWVWNKGQWNFKL